MLAGGGDAASESESEDDEPADAAGASADAADAAGASADAAGASADAADGDDAAGDPEPPPSDEAPSTAATATAPATPRAPEPPPPWALHIARERRSSGLGAGGYSLLSSSFRLLPDSEPTRTRARQFSYDSRDDAQKQRPLAAGFSLPGARASASHL